MNKIVKCYVDKYGFGFSLFDIFFVVIDERAGWAIEISFKDCSPWTPLAYPNSLFIHVRCFYFHIGKWSLTIAWKSDNCYE